MASILLIEPDRVLAAIYFQALTAQGHDVSVAPGAQSAIMAADRSLPQIVVIELQLVDHSGIEFLYELFSYSEWQDIKIIVLSHIPPAEFSSAAEIFRSQLGMVDYLYKPHATNKDLLASVARAVDLQLA